MSRIKVGVQIHPQQTAIADLRRAWCAADEAGFDSIWTWDHFLPLYGDLAGPHFEGWTLLAAMAVETSRAQLGILVSCNSYRNPELLADMARTNDHLSGGRTVLGIGAGWFERDYEEYGYDFATAPDRLRSLERSLERIHRRVEKLNPPPVGRLPIMIGGGGEQVTLRLVAQHADLWNLVTNDPAAFGEKNAVLDGWCRRTGRDPADIERSVCFVSPQGDDPSDFVRAGATHLIVQWPHPFDLDVPRRVLERYRSC